MVAQEKYWQPDFDPSATFIVAGWPKGFTVRGVQPKRGAIFDKTSVPLDMLRAHYEARWITVAEPWQLPKPADVVGASAEELTALVGEVASTPPPAPKRRPGRGAAV